MLGGLLVGEHRDRLLGRSQRIRDGLLRVLGVSRAGEVIGELGQVAGAATPLGRLDRLAHALVEPGPPWHRHPLVQRLPDQRVREQVVAWLLVGLDQEPGRERLLERAQELILAEHDDPLEQRSVHIAADHRCHPEEIDRGSLEPAQAPGDDLRDALGQPDAPERGGARAAGVRPRLDQVADDLFDEERVALGLRVEGVRQRPRGGLAGPQPNQLGGVGLAQAPDVELGGQPISLQLGERGGERVAARLARPVSAEDQQPRRAAGPREVAQEQERRLVGPLEVVQDEEHRRRAGELGEQPHDGLEQPIALGLRLVNRRRRKVGRTPAQLGDQPGELGAVLARGRPQVAEWGVQGPVAKRLEDRLVGDHRLARRASGEHDRARIVDPTGKLGGQRALADPGIAGEQRHPTGALLPAGQLPQPLELLELMLAPDQRPLGAMTQLGGERDRGRHRLRRRGSLGGGLRPEQPIVRGDGVGGRARAELVAQQRPQPVEHPHRFGDVAPRGERLHQDHVARLAVGL